MTSPATAAGPRVRGNSRRTAPTLDPTAPDATAPDPAGSAVPTAAGEPSATVTASEVLSASGPEGSSGEVGAAADHDRKGPGRPRSPRADEAIIDAVLDLLAEGTTAEALAIETIATRAGVGKATIYRRWPNKEALLVDAVASVKGPLPEVRGESVREDMLALLRPIGRTESSRAGQITPGLITQMARSRQLHACYQRIVEPRRDLMRQVLRRGVAGGELRADLDIEVVMAMLTAPMTVQALLNWNPNLPATKLPERLIDAIWPAIVCRP
jgi:AcrR family transcriptional regulator